MRFSTDGAKGLAKAVAELDPLRCFQIMAAFFSAAVLNAIKDYMAEEGLTEDDLKELIEKHQPTKQ
jgi:hypothetical protein